MKNKIHTAGSLISALLASVCCIGPVFFAAIGVGAGASGLLADTARFLAWLTPFRPIFIGFTYIFLGIGFYRAYRKVVCQGERCNSDINTVGIYPASRASVEGEAPSGFAGGGGDASPCNRRRDRIILWFITILVTILILYPYKSYVGL